MIDDSEADEPIAELHDHLRATEERPIERDANRWIGEAQAVAADLVGADLPEDVLRERVGHVRDLLAEVDGTGDAEADRRVAAAADLADEILAESDD